MSSVWKTFADHKTTGITFYDGDVTIDEMDYRVMLSSIMEDPEAIWTAPVRIWPHRTNFPDWIWSHRRDLRPGDDPLTEWQKDTDDPDLWSFGFTYIPARLMNTAIDNGLEEWVYPKVDVEMSLLAKKEDIPCKVVRGDCHPKHLSLKG